MGASIGKACLCPSFLRTQTVFLNGMFGFHGQNEFAGFWSQHTQPQKVEEIHPK
jgi:hypothetical protein